MSHQAIEAPFALEIIGVPTSAASFAPGQEKAPQALRDAGLIEALERAGIRVVDCGDLPVWRWRPDKTNPYAQNLTAVVEYVMHTRERVHQAIAEGHIPLVLGGNCTIEIGTVTGYLPSNKRIGLIYLDLHADMNVPKSTDNGALDWMGMAHMLNLDGALPELSRLGLRYPLLAPEDVVFFGFDPSNATEWELEHIERLGLRCITYNEVARDPEGEANRVLTEWGAHYDRLLVHFDVDVIDFVDMPLSENYSRNQGLSFEQTMQALTTFIRSDKFGALTITELNPDHGDEDGSTLRAFIQGLVATFSASRLSAQ